jgi:hypothetical protein
MNMKLNRKHLKMPLSGKLISIVHFIFKPNSIKILNYIFTEIRQTKHYATLFVFLIFKHVWLHYLHNDL